MINKEKVLFLILAKSSTGKDFIVDKICKDFNKQKVISRTERKPRWESENTHLFVSHEQAYKEYDRNDVIAKDIVYGNRYYTLPEDDIKNKDFYIINPQGIRKMKKNDLNLCIVYLKVNPLLRFLRIIKRDKLKAFKRLILDIKEFKGAEDMADIVCTPKEFYNMFEKGELK